MLFRIGINVGDIMKQLPTNNPEVSATSTSLS